MAVTIKSEREIELMREAGRLLAKTHAELEKEIHAGMTTKEVDHICEEIIRSYGCVPSFLNYNGFPASVCVSINDEVVHGIPTRSRVIHEGDIVSLDTGLIYKGYQSDAARTYGIGAISREAEKLIEVTRQSFFEGMKFAKAGNHLNDIGTASPEILRAVRFRPWCVIWSGTASALRCTSPPRCPILIRGAEESA